MILINQHMQKTLKKTDTDAFFAQKSAQLPGPLRFKLHKEHNLSSILMAESSIWILFYKHRVFAYLIEKS